MYEIVYTQKAAGQIPELKAWGLDAKAKAFLEILRENPYQNPPSCEALKGDLQGAYSRRINILYRLIYQVYEKEKKVKLISLWNPLPEELEDGRLLAIATERMANYDPESGIPAETVYENLGITKEMLDAIKSDLIVLDSETD